MNLVDVEKLIPFLSKQEREEIDALLFQMTVDPLQWILKNVYVPELRGPIQLAPYQQFCLREALAVEPDGTFRYSTIVWSDIKKSIKSTIAAAVALWRAMYTPWGQILMVANDLKQADSRVGYYLRRSIELNPELKSMCRQSGYKVEFPNNATTESIPIDPTGEAGSNADMVIFCLDQDTEIMTRKGWRGYETLSREDEIATLSKDGEFQWQVPVGIFIQDYSGELVTINSRRFSMAVTPDHRVYGKFLKNPNTLERRNNTPWELRAAKEAELSPWFYPRLTCNSWNGKIQSETITIPATKVQPEIHVKLVDWVEFLAWYLSEGCVIQKAGEKPYGVSIGQSEKYNPKKRASILALIRRMGLVPREWAGGMSIAIWNVSLGKMLVGFGKSGDKYIPDWIKDLPIEYLKLFIKTYIAGDGYTVGNGFSITTNSWKMRDDLEEIAQKCGYLVADWASIDKRWGGKTTQYTVRIIGDNKSQIEIKRPKWKREKYTGKVYCPSTKNGIIFVRRNGKCYWTGNSELWGSHNKAQKRMWSEMTLPPAKHGHSFRWVETYAGYEGESVLLKQLYDMGTQGELIPGCDQFDPPLRVYRNDRLFLLWNDTPRLPWQTPEYYASEAKILEPGEFDRIHRNQWTSSMESFVFPELWDACHSEKRSVLDAHDPVIVAMDAGVSGDCFGIVAVYRDEGITEIVEERVWVPPSGGKISYEGEGGPEEYIRYLCDRYNVIEICYDEYQLHSTASRLRKELVTYFRVFPQGQDRLIADKMLKDAIRERTIRHHGEEKLRDHVLNAIAKLEGEKIRLMKKSDKLKIDLAVCLSMANNRAVESGL